MMDIRKQIANVQRLFDGGHIKKYIDFIQFPYYRNLEINSRIDFEFPLSVFIGQNGCGKSSVLHAIFGTVYGKTPYQFWFDTQVDPIEYYDDERRRHSFWYSYKDDNGETKEVIKARIRRKNDPNYWETSRPLEWAGMRTRPSRNERDSPIRKNILYLDFRSELSAFDKFFYFGDLRNSSSRNKQEFIRRKSGSLKKIFDETRLEIRSSTRALNERLEHLTTEELKWISFILGRKYLAGKSVKHSIFRSNGYSVLLNTKFAQYSEAFAGSGEIAVTRLVTEVLKASNYSLILLDEPEVSLHPGAQKRLTSFLLEQIIRKKHQIVLTTHSPSIIRGLPKTSINVFLQSPTDGRFSIKQNLIPEEAFFHIESPVENKRFITVEDKLAKTIVERVLDGFGEERRELFHVKHNPGGEGVIKKEFASIYCREENSKEFILLDGDQIAEHTDWRTLSTNDLNPERLDEVIFRQTGERVKFSVDGGTGGGNNEQKVELRKKYLDYYKNNVFYLPGEIPEDLIWNDEKAFQMIELFVEDEETRGLKRNDIQVADNSKKKFAKLALTLHDENDSATIFSLQKLFLTHWINNESEELNTLKRIFESILEREHP